MIRENIINKTRKRKEYKMYKFFVTEEQIEENIVHITDEDVNHIKNVLRLDVNEQIEIANITNGNNYVCKITHLTSKQVDCQIVETLEVSKEAKVYLHIFQGLPKAEKLEYIIQKAVEVGVSEITPVIMKRCIVKLEDNVKQKKTKRWQKIAEVAAKQSKRDRIPNVNVPINLKNIYENLKEYDIVLVAYENEQNNSIKTVLQQIQKKQSTKIAIVIGPEGGLENEEVEQLQQHGAKIVTLGKRILRTETAPIVMASVIMYEFDEME